MIEKRRRPFASLQEGAFALMMNHLFMSLAKLIDITKGYGKHKLLIEYFQLSGIRQNFIFGVG